MLLRMASTNIAVSRSHRFRSEKLGRWPMISFQVETLSSNGSGASVRSATPIRAPSSSNSRRSRSAVAAGLRVNLPPVGCHAKAASRVSQFQSRRHSQLTRAHGTQHATVRKRVGCGWQGLWRTVERELLRHVGGVNEQRQRGGVNLLTEKVERIAVRAARVGALLAHKLDVPRLGAALLGTTRHNARGWLESRLKERCEGGFAGCAGFAGSDCRSGWVLAKA